ncbi:AMY [Mytilus edulis]|uniref:alpha-amylase n=1 Tax=Mytilus edulis TaxID=6550 RepID=A0A8S3VE80_MYTED|nr:AMY [Mytilus edulis]
MKIVGYRKQQKDDRILTHSQVMAYNSALHADYTDPHCSGKQAIVHLFEWKFSDIANECERYLGKKGFCGVQTSPVNEYTVITKEYIRPWWERYQPVSYKIASRSGNEAEFKDMVDRCKNVGVRIYVDVVINHMAGPSNYDFPGVPFSRQHFNDKDKCPSHDGMVNNYGDPNNVRNCFLVGLTDLDQKQEYVRNKIAGFFNHLIDLGVAGFRVDAAKHMWPGDILAIQKLTKDLPEGGTPFFYHEVIDQNDGAIKVNEYYPNGLVTEFRFCQKIAQGARNFGELGGVYDPGWGMADSDHAFVFVDNHDNQRGHGGGGNRVTHKTPRDYKIAVAFMLANDYGFPRIMSSYYFGDDSSQGPPHNSDYSIKDVTIENNGLCGNGWVCEHRWNPIGNMVAFRNAVAGTTKVHWKDQNDQVSFARGNKGFFAMAKQGHMDETLQTGLPAGEYCDLITDCKKKITVDGSGNAHIVIDNSEEPILAFIVGGPSTPSNTGVHSGTSNTNSSGTGSGTGSGSGGGSGIVSPTNGPVPKGFHRTIILFEGRTAPGQDLFIRGGIDEGHRQGCQHTAAASACAIPIKSHDLGSSDHFAKYNAWRQGDSYLDWYGAEPGQGDYHGQTPQGTPAVWTTNQPGKPGYNELNTYGEHFWLVDIEMDCDKTENGWFEVKAVINNNWENNVPGNSCHYGNVPYRSQNHWARCGMKNVLHFSAVNCEISEIPTTTIKTQDEYRDPHCDGKQVIVELFEWRFADIANECERFLGDKDFCGVQVSPVTEHVAIFDRPWYERYQPVSYKIESRSGNETEFKDMVDRCKNVGIRIYVDVVLNHMAEPSMNNKGIAGSTFNSSSLEFPAVPYNRSHFNARTKCPTQDGKIHSYNQPDEIRNCHLDKLPDLDQSQSFVRSKIVNLLNHLIDLGVSGFRVDRAKFMHPEDILAIEKLTRNLTDGGKPFFFNHVQDYNQDSIKSSEYYQNGRVTEFQFGRKLAAGINNFALLNGLQYPSSGMADSAHAFVFVDNHDNQRSDISNILTHKTPREYKMANAFMLANDYGFTRVMSSYYFGDDTNLSPPQYTNNSMKDPITSIKQQGTCGHDWVCEHRWPSIANMVVFRNAVEGTWKTHWINKNNQLSFARGTKGFFAMAKNGKMNETLDTGLPAGEYCDLITDCKKTVIVEANGYALIEIDNADRPILAFIVDGPLAYPKTHFGLHTGNVIGNVIVGGSFSRSTTKKETTTVPVSSTVTDSITTTGAVTDTTSRVVTMSSQATTPSTITTTITSSSVTTVRTTTSSPKCKDTKRTVIFFQEYTVSGQYLFIRGGIDDNHRAGCKNVPTASMSNCSIPISSHNVGSSVHYAAYNAWRQGDTLLDWQGPEPSQGKFQGKGAYGTPAVWTTNDPNDERYNHLNQ